MARQFLRAAALLLLHFISSCLSICIIEPYPRGAQIDFKIRNNPACSTSIAPCGSGLPGAPSVDLIVGTKLVVKFQKNHDMFYSVNPGVFELNLISNNAPPMNLWMSWDSDTTWTFIYEADFTVPPLRGPGVLQVVYRSKNPMINFSEHHQCIDVLVR